MTDWLKEARQEEEYKREQYGFQSKGDYLWKTQGAGRRSIGKESTELVSESQDSSSILDSSTKQDGG